uniref:Uncharacterized protein n=1 Tax=Arundo donax TaxID=35708 RepID=A0A0A9DW86_ARUDO
MNHVSLLILVTLLHLAHVFLWIVAIVDVEAYLNVWKVVFWFTKFLHQELL